MLEAFTWCASQSPHCNLLLGMVQDSSRRKGGFGRQERDDEDESVSSSPSSSDDEAGEDGTLANAAPPAGPSVAPQQPQQPLHSMLARHVAGTMHRGLMALTHEQLQVGGPPTRGVLAVPGAVCASRSHWGH